MRKEQIALLMAGVILLLAGLGLLAAQLSGGGSLFPADSIRDLREADEYLRQNNEEATKKALGIFTSVLARDESPRTNAYAKYGMAVALEKRHELQLALEHYRELKTWQIEDAKLRDKIDFSLGRLYLYINHEVEGRSLLEPLLVRTKNNKLKSRIHQAFGNFYLRRGDTKRAAANFRVALKYYPENLAAQTGKAIAQEGARNEWLFFDSYNDYLFGDAWLDPKGREQLLSDIRREAYEAGIRAYRHGNTERAEHYFLRVLQRAGQSEGAFSSVSSSLHMSDELSEKAQYWLAETYQKAGKNKLAFAAFGRVLENSNTSMDQPALIKQGILLFNERKLKEAAVRFQKAIDDFPAGNYTERAIEWRREIRAQLREKELLDRFSD